MAKFVKVKIIKKILVSLLLLVRNGILLLEIRQCRI